MTTAVGRDRRAVRHLAPDGAPDAALLPRRPHAIVVGAGIAGLAAAAGLAERGVRVTVAEREPYLGGRVGGWTQPTAGPPADAGQPAAGQRPLTPAARPGGPADEPRVPRLLPPVLQPAGAAAPRRPGAAAARPADRLPAGGRRRPPGQLPRSASHPAVERDRVRAAQPHLPAPGPARAERRGGGPAGGRERPGHLRTARRHRRRDVPAGHQLPGRRPAPGLRGVLAQLLRPARRDVRGRAGFHVPHLFSRLQRGPGVRRARRRFRHRPVGAAARLPDGAGRDLPDRDRDRPDPGRWPGALPGAGHRRCGGHRRRRGGAGRRRGRAARHRGATPRIWPTPPGGTRCPGCAPRRRS